MSTDVLSGEGGSAAFIKPLTLFLVIALLSQFVFPVLALLVLWALPPIFGNVAFFWPQNSLFIFGLTHDGDASRLAVEPLFAITLASAAWICAGLIFAFLVRRAPTRWRISLAFLAVLGVGILIPYAAWLAGFPPYLEGP